MGRAALIRLAGLIAVLVGLTIAIFVIRSVLPADPVRASLGPNASQQQVDEKRHLLGYDKPLWHQYVSFVAGVSQGDLGTSLRTRRPVTEDIGQFAPATVELALFAALLAGLLGIALGLWSVTRGRGSAVVRAIMVSAASLPTFFVAILLILLFYRRLSWLPASGRLSETDVAPGPTGLYLIDSLLQGNLREFFDALRHLVIPGVCLAVGPGVAIGRVLRSSLLSVIRQDHVRTARAKGLAERRVVLRHVLRNALGPVLSMAGLQMGLLLTGVVVVELVMAWPGLGLYMTQAIQYSDFPAIIGMVLVLGTVYVLVNAVVDILQLVADPRVREKGRI